MIKRKFLKTLAAISIFSILTVAQTSNALAADSTFKEGESYGTLDNDSFDTAEQIITTPLSSSSASYLEGALGNSPAHKTDINNDVDYYKVNVGTTTGNKGRFAIKLESIPTGCNYDLYLYDANQNQLGISVRTGNTNEIVRTPEISSSTIYYIKVVQSEGTSVDPNTNYRIKLENTVQTVTNTFTATPTNLNSTGTAKSNSGLADLRSKVPADALVRNITVSATKSTSSLSTNYKMYVSSGNHTTWETGEWNGQIAAFNVADPSKRAKAMDAWYIAFSATPINPSTLNVTTISSPKMTMTYEYDTSINY